LNNDDYQLVVVPLELKPIIFEENIKPKPKPREDIVKPKEKQTRLASLIDEIGENIGRGRTYSQRRH
jgi:hypothetical protein